MTPGLKSEPGAGSRRRPSSAGGPLPILLPARLLLTLLLAVCLWPAFSGAALAAEGDPQIKGLRLGFSGQYKVGYWTPIEVTIEGGKQSFEGVLELTVPDGDGVPTRIVGGKPVTALPARATTVNMFAKIGQQYPEISVRLISADGKEIRGTFNSNDGKLASALDASRPLVVTVGQPLGVATKTAGDEAERSTVYAAITSATGFPTRWYGYEAADTVILCTSNAELYRQLSGASAQVTALDTWVRLGGQLIFCVGSQADEILAADAPLARFAPGKFAGMVALKRTNAWESYAAASDRLDAQAMVDADSEVRFDVPRLEDVRGQIEAYEGSKATDLPLVVRAPYGLGEVVFVAADLDRPPFANWSAREQMLGKLLGKPDGLSGEAGEDTTATSTFGYTDISGQLRGALEQFEGVKLVPFSLVALLIVLYILAIGPLDYLLLKRGLKRMEWTWFTFPAIVLAFSAMAYFLAYWLKGDQLLTNQVDVIDYDAESSLVRGTTWTNLFSPRVDSYDLHYQPSLPDKSQIESEERLISWTGLPGDSFAGMSSPGGAAGLFTGGYAFSPALDRLEGMPIAVWSTKGVTGRWHGTATAPIVGELIDRGDNMLAGSLQSRLDEPLTDCVLVYGRWAYPIGTLDARARFSVEKKLDPQTVETYFKRISLFNENEANSTYDPASVDVGRIVETMMFHEHLGGVDYAKLSNQYQQFVDLSGLLRCGRAILVGRGPKAGGQLMRGADDGQPVENAGDRRWTFYRFVFTVGNPAED